MRRLTIQVEPDFDVETEQFLQRVKHGLATGEYQGEHLSFATADQFFRDLTPNRWRMVHHLMGKGEVGVRALARQLGRDVRRVHEDAATLVELGLLERSEYGALCCPYARIHIDMTLEPSAQEMPALAKAA